MYFASFHLISTEITLGLIFKMGTELKQNKMFYLKKEKPLKARQLPFLRQISSSHLGQHSFFILPIQTWSSQPSLCKNNSRGTSPQPEQQLWPKWAASCGEQLHMDFLTPSGMVTLKTMENCQVRPQLRAVCLHSRRVSV